MMSIKLKICTVLLMTNTCQLVFAKDISGLWQSIDDQTGAPKGIVELKSDANGIYTGTIKQVTPRLGYTPKEFCVNCPAPYTGKAIVGLNAITGLKKIKDSNYGGGKILDPNTGKIYNLKARLSANGKRLQLRGYIGISALGRSQTWIRIE